ncbi:SAM-dependent methyltransferase [Scytonema tolypothrichoides VB-61278]|nr:SAM-dependent methyltransferase [Scytonema tolypothrichoides VB-61278]
MSETINTSKKKIFGDFQTPKNLAVEVMNCLKQSLNIQPAAIIEPTCGKGAFLLAAIDGFPDASSYMGVEINTDYFRELNGSLKNFDRLRDIQTFNFDFFAVDWHKQISLLPEPILITGNPPWVTNSSLGVLEANNLPMKNNFQARNGLEAITGKANFDISEWMILQYLEWLKSKKGTIAVLCKTAVARKILFQVWKQNKPIEYAAIHMINALSHFGASVDACLFVVQVGTESNYHCFVFNGLTHCKAYEQIGYKDDMILSDIDAYSKFSDLKGKDSFYTWRSGIKHDCSKVMELSWDKGSLTNGLGQSVNIEDTYTYPLLKSSDLGNGRVKKCRKKVIVTQTYIGENTALIQNLAPQTWDYLEIHRETLAARKSSIYKKRPPFSIFGVGDYSFAPWKVAISGLYKQLKFFSVGPIDGKPVMFDDTVYFLPCRSQGEAEFICALLNSQEARTFLESMIFWNDKRPITIDLLKRLSIVKLAKLLKKDEEYMHYTSPCDTRESHNLLELDLVFA